MHRNGTQADAIRVLLVDDDYDFTNVLRKRLARRGFSVRTAADGGEAFAMVESEPFDVVVLDVGLPDVNGMQLLKAIKRQSRTIEFIVLTGGRTGCLESFRAGAFDLFHKPAGADVLADRIMEAARCRTVPAK
ncbi:MAG: response regulator [Desulfovibrionaceae bacterium]|nr:response regulator [Desulfovibrionaceae bacterium]